MVYISAASLTKSGGGPPGALQGAPTLDRARRPRSEEHWNWPQGSTVTITCYSNCPEIQLALNGRPIGTKRLEEAVEGVLSWIVPFEPGTLKAVGLRDGKPACEFSLQTAGPAKRIVLLPDTDQLRADGKDICHAEFQIFDAKGVRVPDASQMVTFEVEGPAKIIGIGNGDLNNSEDPLNSVHQAFQGRGLAILQSKTEAGRITLRATAPGLEQAAVTLTSR
jgi:beta-galactosidase